MRVLLVFDWFLKVAEGQAAGLRANGHEVMVLCRDHALEYGGDHAVRATVVKRLREGGVEVVELEGRRYHPEGLPSTLRARREVRRFAPDVVSAHANEDTRLLALSRAAPIVLTVHDPHPHPGQQAPRSIGAATARAWERSAARIVVQGEQLVAELPADPRRSPVRVVPHGIRVSEHALAVPGGPPVVLLFGRLEPYKGVEVLMAAIARLWERRPDARVIVAGRGPEARHVVDDERIELLERYISEAELEALYARATLSVLPYTQASQSGVGVESIARGVPVVVTRTGALPELALNPEDVVAPGDPVALAAALDRRLDQTAELRAQVLADARERFDWVTVARRYAEVYEEVIE